MEGIDPMSTLDLLKQQNAAGATALTGNKPTTADALSTVDAAPDPAPEESPQLPGASVTSPDDIKKMKLKDVNALFESLGEDAIAASGLKLAWPTLSMPAKKDELIDLFFPDQANADPAPTEAAVAETPAPAKASKATAKKVEAQVVAEGDLIASTAQEIENVKDAQTAVQCVHDLQAQQGFSNFKLGGYLSLIQTKAWFGDHPTFKAFIESETDLDYRKAMYLISIYNGLVEADIAWEKVAVLGWTKLKELVGVLNKDNVDDWVEKAKSSTVLQLMADIQAHKKSANESNGGTDSEPAADSIVSTLTFKVHEDQKETVNAAIEKAMKATGTDSKTVAMEHIALDYLAGNVKKADKKDAKADTPPALTVEDVVQKFEIEDIFRALRKLGGDAYNQAIAEAVLGSYDAVWPEVSLDVEYPAPVEA